MFYKTNKPEVLSAFQAHMDAKKNLKICAENFSKEFGNVEAIISYSFERTYFAGVKFIDRSEVNFNVWTLPQRQYFCISRLRAKPKKKHKEAWGQEVKRYSEAKEKCFPNGTEAHRDLFVNTLGTSCLDLVFSGLNCFLFDGSMYIETSAKINAIEILGSEYQAAREKFKETEKAAKK